MTRDDIIKMAREAGIKQAIETPHLLMVHELERFAELVAAVEREKVARWMTERGYATGHGNTIEDLLTELEWQIREQEREACAKVVEILIPEQTEEGLIGHTIAKAIREARRLTPYTTPPVQEFVCSTGFCRFTLTQTGVGINVPDEEKCKK